MRTFGAMRWIGAVVIAIVACGPGGSPPHPDAADPVVDVPPGCPPVATAASFDFFGESCDAAPYPANTVCRTDPFGTDRGWCIGPDAGGPGVCRPMAYDPSRCPVCPGGTQRRASGGAAYCAP